MTDHYGPQPTADEILDALDPEQRRVAKSVDGAVCVLAGAGTGKTRAITHRIAYGVLTGVMQPMQTLAVTFTARAAGEMRGRLRQLGVPGVQARTFHAAALRQLQFFWPRTYGSDPPRLAERKAPLVAEAVQDCRLRADRTELRDLTGEIEWAKATQTAPDDYPDQVRATKRKPPRDAAEIARVYAAYEKIKSGRGQMDFEDVLLLTVGLLDAHFEVREQVQAQYRHFTVDEYQDVNPLQQRLLDVWSQEARSLCVVGDASQTIYSFTGATPGFLLGFRQRHRASEVIELVRDYRSTPQVVRLANRLLTHASGAAAEHRLELVSQRDDGPAPEFVEFADEPAEAEGVARRIRKLLDQGVRAAEIAVLFRTNAQSEGYEQALADADIPYVLRGAERFFERPEVRQAAVLLRGAARSGGGPAAGDDAVGLAAEVGAVLADGGWSPRPPSGSGQVRERWESLNAIVRLAEDFAAARPGATLPDFVAELAERANAQHAPTVDGVTLASLHAAKGLEWDAVFLVGLTEGMMPITYADTDDKIEEERRLLYVGITRAREHLTLSWALARSPGGRSGRRPSRFLDGLRGDSRGPALARRARGSPGRHVPPSAAPSGRDRAAGQGRAGALPGLRARAGRRRRAQIGPVHGVSVRPRRGAVRAAGRLAARPSAGARSAGVLRVHRRHLDRDRGGRAELHTAAGEDLRSHPGEDRQVRCGRPRDHLRQLRRGPRRSGGGADRGVWRRPRRGPAATGLTGRGTCRTGVSVRDFPQVVPETRKIVCASLFGPSNLTSTVNVLTVASPNSGTAQRRDPELRGREANDMSSNIKLVAATAVAPTAMSVRSAELGALKPASPVALKGRNLSAYAETDARVISVDTAAMRRRGQSIGLASNVERGWQGSERTSVVTPDALTACEQQQVEGMAHAVGTAGFAGLHGYPSWKTRT